MNKKVVGWEYKVLRLDDISEETDLRAYEIDGKG